MATISAVVRWADNTADLKRHLQEGLNQIEATKASAEKMVQTLSGDRLIEAAHRYAAAVQQLGGVERLNAQEKERINTLITKAIEKYQLLGKTAPDSLHQLAAATQSASKETQELNTRMVAIGASIGTFVGTLAGNVFSKFVGGLSDIATSAFTMNASLETTTLKFTTLMGNADQAKAHVKDLFEIAKKTPFETGPIIEASLKLQTFGGAALNTKANIMLLGDASAATGAPIQELGFWVGRMYAMLQGGKPFGEAAMRLQELAVLTPQARDKMEAMQKAGKSAAEIFDVFKDSLKGFTGAMETQAGTWAGVMSTFTDTVNMLIANVLKPYFEVIRDLGRHVNEALDGMSTSFDGVAEKAVHTKGAFIDLISGGIGGMTKAITFLMVEANAIQVVFKDVMQVIDGVRLAYLGARQAMTLGLLPGQADLGKWKELDDQIAHLEVTMKERGDSIQRDKAQQQDWITWGNKSIAAVDAMSASLKSGTVAVAQHTSAIGEFVGPLRDQADATATLADRVRGLTDAQRADILSKNALKESIKAIATETGITADVVSTFLKQQKAATSGTNAMVNAWKEYASASENARATVDAMNQSTVEAIKYDLARVKSQSTLEKIYGVTATQIKAIVEVEKFEQSVLDATQKSYGTLIAIVPDLSKRTQEFNYELQHLTKDGLIPTIDGFDDLARAELALKVYTDDLSRSQKALQQQLAHTIELMPDLSKQAKEHMDGIRKAGAEAGLTYTAALANALDRIPDIFKQAFTGGGGVAGALKALAIQFAEDIGRVLAQRLAQTMTRAFANSAAQSGAETAAGLVQGNKGENIGSKVAGSIATMGIYAGVLAVVALYKKLHDAEWEKLGKDIGRQFGVALSEAALRAMEADSKKFGRQATTILHLDEIIAAAGGLTSSNIGQFASTLRDVFSMIETHQLSIAQGTEVLEKNWDAFAKAGTDAYGLLRKELVEVIELQRKFGTTSAAITAYTKSQLEGVATGFNAVAGATIGRFTRAIETIGSNGDKLVSLREDADRLAASISDLERSGIKTDKQRAQLSAWQRQLADVQTQITMLEGQNELAKKTLEDVGTAGQEAFDRTGRLAIAAFASALAAGQGFLQAITSIGPGLDLLQQAMNKFGFTSSSTLDTLLQFRKFANENKELVAGIDGLNQMMTGLANSGFLTQDVFDDLSKTAFDFYQQAMKGGLTSTQALVMMQPTLQRIWQLHKDNGLAIDENTQKMLDEAEANGIVGEKMRSTEDKMLQVLIAIAHVLGAVLPDAFEQTGKAAADAARKAQEEIDKLPKKIDIPIDFPLPGSGPPPIPNPFPETAHSGAIVTADGLQKFHRGTAKVLQFHRGGFARDEVPAILQTGESVLNRQATNFLGGDVIGGLNRGIRGTISPDGIVINNEITVEVDARGALNDPAAADRIARQIGPAIVKQIQLNVDGMYTKMRGSLGLAS